MKKKMTIINATVVIIGFAVAFLLSSFQVQNEYRRQFTRQLDMVLSVLSLQESQIESNPEQVSQQVGKALSQNGQQVLISIIRSDGTVIGDSSNGEINSNQLSQSEVQQALKSGHGYAIRTSQSTNERYQYAAEKLNDQYLLRAALPVSEMDAALSGLWRRMLLCMCLGLVIVCAATVVFASRTIRPLQGLTAAAEKISRSDFSGRVEVRGHDEVAQLSKSFNRMANSVEEALHDLEYNQNLLKGVLEAMDNGVIAVGKDHCVLFFNERARELRAVPRLAVGGKMSGGLAITHVAAIMRKTRKVGETFQEEMTGSTPNQHLIVYTSLLEDRETVIAVLSDVTRVKELEQMRSEFVGNVTHELKTPLTSIRASIELLKSGNRDEETRSYFYDVLDMEAERLQHLIDDMLVLSRLENARDDPSVKPCNVADTVRVCVQRLALAAKKNHVTVVDQKIDPKLFVRCTPSRLEQLFTNLIENAIKYNKPDGMVEITGASQQEIAVIRVRDTGIGIAQEHIPRLFERFYRVDTSRSREIGGTGLGLSIVKHIAALYGGEVNVESTPGVGSTFTVRLPCSAPPSNNQ